MSSLLQKLAFRGCARALSLLHSTTRKRKADAPESVFVLAQHQHACIGSCEDKRKIVHADLVVIGKVPSIGKRHVLDGNLANGPP